MHMQVKIKQYHNISIPCQGVRFLFSDLSLPKKFLPPWLKFYVRPRRLTALHTYMISVRVISLHMFEPATGESQLSV